MVMSELEALAMTLTEKELQIITNFYDYSKSVVLVIIPQTMDTSI